MHPPRTRPARYDRVVRWRCLAAAVLALSLGVLTAPAAELVGVLRVRGQTYVALQASPDTTARWVPVGGRFAGYTVAEFDPHRDVVVLAQAEQRLELGLQAASVGRSEQVLVTPEPDRITQLALRAAYQLLFDHGASVVGGREVAATIRTAEPSDVARVVDVDFRLTATGELALADGRRMSGLETIPVHILVPPGTSLGAVAQRLHLSEPALTTLNPGFENPPAEGPPRTVRVR